MRPATQKKEPEVSHIQLLSQVFQIAAQYTWYLSKTPWEINSQSLEDTSSRVHFAKIHFFEIWFNFWNLAGSNFQISDYGQYWRTGSCGGKFPSGGDLNHWLHGWGIQAMDGEWKQSKSFFSVLTLLYFQLNFIIKHFATNILNSTVNWMILTWNWAGERSWAGE